MLSQMCGNQEDHLEKDYKEHLKAPSPIFQHQSSSGHATSIDNFKIIGREDNSLARTIKESIYIRVNNPHTQQEYWEIQPPTHLG